MNDDFVESSYFRKIVLQNKFLDLYRQVVCITFAIQSSYMPLLLFTNPFVILF